jgi:hypothetical protein
MRNAKMAKDIVSSAAPITAVKTDYDQCHTNPQPGCPCANDGQCPANAHCSNYGEFNTWLKDQDLVYYSARPGVCSKTEHNVYC